MRRARPFIVHGVRTSRIRRTIAVGATTLASLAWMAANASPVAAEAEPDLDTTAEQVSLSRVNSDRDANGLDALRVSNELVAVARAHSRDMAEEGRLYHNPDVDSEVQGWQSLGENVGRGPNADDVHDAFMNSDGHRSNILGNFTLIGVGAYRTGDTVWITQVFETPADEPDEEPERVERKVHSRVRAAAPALRVPAPAIVRIPRPVRRVDVAVPPPGPDQTVTALDRLAAEFGS